MGNGTLTIYSASAGSGKTYRLTGIYLADLFKSRHYYRKILAVTFTHKATAEMKSRILDNLHKLAVGEDSGYLSELIKETGRKEDWLRDEAKEILNAILHDYSRFSVSTIDSFFQKILRSFTREVGLHTGFNVELDHTLILSSAIEEMIASSVTDPQLKDWLTTYALANIEEEKSWNLKEAIVKLAEELFKEKFKILSADERSVLADKRFLLEYIKKLKTITFTFKDRLKDFGLKAREIFRKYDLADDLFYRKGQGVPRFVRLLADGATGEPNSYVREINNDPPRWSTGTISSQLQAAINNGLDKILTDAIHYYDLNIVEYKSAEAILSNVYALGILSDVLLNIHLITNSENSFLLSDAGEVLNLIIKSDQSPFIYEKVGNRFENFMIDEFQDTSTIQWSNFKPLIENSMADGFDNLVVGDVKQSIYRWRNSDWQILGTVLDKKIDNERFISKPLTTNWRSCSNIIKFNNALFSIIPEQIDESLADETLPVSFKKLYSEAVQTDPGKKDGGYVRLEFIENEKERKWKKVVLERLPAVIESFQDKGYKAADIGIIVRDGKEGAQVLKTIIEYSNNCSTDKKNAYNFNVVSNDSLLISNAPVVNFIISALNVINDPADMINRAGMLRFFLLAKGSEVANTVPLFSDELIEKSGIYFPEGYEKFLDKARQMPLFEVTENLILFFNLGEYSWNVAYLNSFQDFVLGFAGNKGPDLQSFLDWWESTGNRKSVVLPGNQDAIRIMTIHKSKGLEFEVVLLPFISWNLDHLPSNQPILWITPDSEPFNELSIVPVKYSKELLKTLFLNDYKKEKYSVYLDNINLLYVAFTRAKDVIYGFSEDSPGSESTISYILKNALSLDLAASGKSGLNLSGYYEKEKRIFEFGEITDNKKKLIESKNIISSSYHVSQAIKSLKLKLHGENYFSSGSIEIRKKINYGKLMHEIFEGINTADDISYAVRKLVLEGKLPEEESDDIEKRVNLLIRSPQVKDWFLPGNVVLKEAGILLPSGNTRRPDRVVFKDGKTIIIDFKFGEENPHYSEQINHYSHLLVDMGYANIEAFIWYVDKNKVVTA